MLSQRIYYSLKPYLPWRLRIAIRRILAKRLRQQNTETWPIDRAAGCPPVGWPGWPDGKKFALVLTHDVEGPTGLAKCSALADLELDRGFRSTFNLIPEGPYLVPDDLIASLKARGFEIGVHDLKHDGWLFASRLSFEEQAVRINHHLKKWNARGFRAGFMLRNLEWLQRLDLQYDASTFDTDPFEMQSDGTGTVFPFWVPSNAGKIHSPNSSAAERGGYIELPYTLPQDSTLFLLLREKSPDIWLRKVDWIAQNGGMVLVNVHPDYLQLDAKEHSGRTYPVSHYVQLLDYIRQRYGDSFWQPVAGELADYAMKFRPTQPRRPKRICMVTHSFYENDNRVTRYASALATRGDHVDVLALRRSPDLPAVETVDGVNLHRIAGREGKQERSKFDYFWSWIRFFATATAWVARRHSQQPYDVFHIHNMPDFLVFAAWYPRLTGAKVILDIHDITPEFYGSKFGARARRLPAAILSWTERCSARVADHVIISNHLWLEKYTARTGSRDRCSVFINNVDTNIFQPHPRTRFDGRKLIIFPGGLQWHQGLDIALRAFSRVRQEVPAAEFHIYGDGNMKAELLSLTAELGLNDSVRFFDPVGMKEVARIMANADVGVVPKRADSFGNEAYSTKIMEFMSVGVPVVISNTKIDRFYFDDSMVRFFDSGDVNGLATGLIEVLTNESLKSRLVENASAYVQLHAWSTRQDDYFNIVDRLSDGGSVECITMPPGSPQPATMNA